MQVYDAERLQPLNDGYLPRLSAYGEAGPGVLGFLENYPDEIVQPSEMQEVIRQCEADKIFPVFHLGELPIDPKSWSQGNLGYCWAYGLTASVMLARQAEGQKFVHLSPTSLGWNVHWRDQGYYMDRAITGVRERGIAPLTHAPEYVRDPSKFHPDWQKEALKYRPLEWWDIHARRQAIEVLCQCLTVLRTGRPLYVGYMWWGHALCMVGMTYRGSELVVQLWNSHRDGVIGLTGSRAVPDEAYGVRAITVP